MNMFNSKQNIFAPVGGTNTKCSSDGENPLDDLRRDVLEPYSIFATGSSAAAERLSSKNSPFSVPSMSLASDE